MININYIDACLTPYVWLTQFSSWYVALYIQEMDQITFSFQLRN